MRAFCVLVSATVLIAAGCTGSGGSPSAQPSQSKASAGDHTPAPFDVPAAREPLTADPQSAVAHDTEMLALVPHAGELFAATGQWMYPGPSAAGQVLVKRSAASPWAVFEQSQSTRVQALDSFPIPSDQGLGPDHSLLITQAIVNGHSELQWLVDRAPSFAPDNSFTLSSTGAQVRAFGAHEDNGVWSVYAGVEPTGILRGTWSPTRHTLVFDPTPELSVGAPGSKAQRTQKVTGFADCAGAVYVSINTRLFRRNDGALSAGVSRWPLVYQAPPVGAFNSGLRGLTCVTHDGHPALLASTEGNGDVFRLDDLPHGVVGEGAPRLAAALEFSPMPAIRQMLARQGTAVAANGKASVAYVIAAYNNFTALPASGGDAQVFGFEWGYQQTCAAGRTCGPTAFSAVRFDAAACFAVRTDQPSTPRYILHCLSGPQFETASKTTKPIRNGQAFVSIRTIALSPFGDGRVFYGGYDCNFFPADGTAWSASSTTRAAGLDTENS